jgi:FkbM family methyltransferase
MRELWRTVRGVARSLRIYHGNRSHRIALRRLYSDFIQPGDLVFDIGAHVGDRVGAFRALGARVIAVEPQPALAATLRLLYGRGRSVTIEPVAVGRSAGMLALKINLDNPTISTGSDSFINAARNAPGWEGQVWSRQINVPMLTIDQLIARHGRPAFIKIDVEGYEAEALAGLSAPVPALSFEFTTIQRDVAAGCISRCVELGFTKFNASLGESQILALPAWGGASTIAHWLAELPHEANSGDIYAVSHQIENAQRIF